MGQKKRLRIRAARPPRARQRVEEPPIRQRWWVRHPKTLVVGVLALTGGALTSILTSGLLALPDQLFDSSAAEDRVRHGPDFSVSVEPVRLDDEGRSAATAKEFMPTPTQQQELERSHSIDSSTFDHLLHANGAVNLDKVSIRVTLTGNRNQQINIEDIRPLITARTQPLSGSLLCVPSQGGAPTMNLQYDMDRPFPVAHDIRFDGDKGDNEQHGLGPAFFEQRTITLKDHEQQVLLIRAVTRQH